MNRDTLQDMALKAELKQQFSDDAAAKSSHAAELDYKRNDLAKVFLHSRKTAELRKIDFSLQKLLFLSWRVDVVFW